MTAPASSTSISGHTKVAGTPRNRGSWGFIRGRLSAPSVRKAALRPSPAPLGRETALRGKTIDEERRGREDHHQPPGRIHLSRREICLNRRSHPSSPRPGRRIGNPGRFMTAAPVRASGARPMAGRHGSGGASSLTHGSIRILQLQRPTRDARLCWSARLGKARSDWRHKLVQSCELPTRYGETTRIVGLPACPAAIDFRRGDYARAVESGHGSCLLTSSSLQLSRATSLGDIINSFSALTPASISLETSSALDA
jgi:hypothetical protein